MKLTKTLLKCLLAATFLLPSMSSRAQETEPGNDVYTGADPVMTPLARTLTISSGDEDWFLVQKKKCEIVTVKLENEGTVLDGVRIQLYTRIQGLAPSGVVDEKVIVGGGSGSVTFKLTGVTGFYVQVTPIDITGTIDYTLSSVSSNANAPILLELIRNKKRLKRIEKRLKQTNKSKKRKVANLQRRIKAAKAKIRNIRKTLCPE